MSTVEELYEAEVELLLEKVGRVELKAAVVVGMREGAWTGSHGGHDPDFNKLKGGLMEFWMKKARTDPHPFTYCVRHLSKHVANPERLCAWLKDQALGTTKWRKGNKKNLKESDISSEVWVPSIEELQSAMAAYTEAEAELNEELASGSRTSPNSGEQIDHSLTNSIGAGAQSTEGGDEGISLVPPASGSVLNPDGSPPNEGE